MSTKQEKAAAKNLRRDQLKFLIHHIGENLQNFLVLPGGGAFKEDVFGGITTFGRPYIYGDPLVELNKSGKFIFQKYRDTLEEQFPGYVDYQKQEDLQSATERTSYAQPKDEETYTFPRPDVEVPLVAHAYKVCVTPEGEKALIVLFVSQDGNFYFSEYKIVSMQVCYELKKFERILMVISFVAEGVTYRLDYI